MISDTVSKKVSSLVSGRTESSATSIRASIQILYSPFPAHDAANVVRRKPPLCTLLQEHGAHMKNTGTLRRQLPPMELEQGNVFAGVKCFDV